MAFLADGHVLIDDVPGLAKTLDRSLVRACHQPRVRTCPVHARPPAVRYHRLIDLQPARWRLRVSSGPRFRQPSLGRRDQPGTRQDPGGPTRGHAGAPGHDRRADQSAPRSLPGDGTQNPIEFEGTYPLPEAQLDRFLLRITVGYPSRGRRVEHPASPRRTEEG